MACACHRCGGKGKIKVLNKPIDSVVAPGKLYVYVECPCCGGTGVNQIGFHNCR